MPVLSFKVTAEQAREVRRAARLKHKTVSEYLRSTALAPMAQPTKVIMKKHPISGLSYNAAPGQLSPTQAEIDAALADFP